MEILVFHDAEKDNTDNDEDDSSDLPTLVPKQRMVKRKLCAKKPDNRLEYNTRIIDRILTQTIVIMMSTIIR